MSVSRLWLLGLSRAGSVHGREVTVLCLAGHLWEVLRVQGRERPAEPRLWRVFPDAARGPRELQPWGACRAPAERGGGCPCACARAATRQPGQPASPGPGRRLRGCRWLSSGPGRSASCLCARFPGPASRVRGPWSPWSGAGSRRLRQTLRAEASAGSPSPGVGGGPPVASHGLQTPSSLSSSPCENTCHIGEGQLPP